MSSSSEDSIEELSLVPLAETAGADLLPRGEEQQAPILSKWLEVGVFDKVRKRLEIFSDEVLLFDKIFFGEQVAGSRSVYLLLTCC